MRKSLNVLFFILVFSGVGCVSVDDNNQYEPVNSEVVKEEIKAFLLTYNRDENASVRQTLKPLYLKSINSKEKAFTAILCEKPTACTSEELSQRDTDYMLVKGDVNNDRILETVFVAVGQGSDLIDVILAVYQQEANNLVLVPFHKTIAESLGENAKKNWPTRLGEPFITQHNNENYINFEGQLVWKDTNGNTLFGNQLEKASHGVIMHYSYLWKANSIQLKETRTQVIKREEGP